MEVVGVIATALLAICAIFTTGVNYYLLRGHFDPYVVVYTRHDNDRPTILELVIENLGDGAAYDVSFNWEGELPQTAYGISPTGEDRDFEPMTEGPLVSGIPLLAPGERRVMNWGQYGGLADALEGDRVQVTSEYESRGPHVWDPSEHSVESVLEVQSFEATNAASSPEHDQVDALEGIEDHLGTIAKVAEAPLVKKRIKRLEEKMGWGEEDEDG